MMPAVVLAIGAILLFYSAFGGAWAAYKHRTVHRSERTRWGAGYSLASITTTAALCPWTSNLGSGHFILWVFFLFQCDLLVTCVTSSGQHLPITWYLLFSVWIMCVAIMWVSMQIHVMLKEVLDINFGDWTNVKVVSTEIHERLLCSRSGLCASFTFLTGFFCLFAFWQNVWFCKVASP